MKKLLITGAVTLGFLGMMGCDQGKYPSGYNPRVEDMYLTHGKVSNLKKKEDNIKTLKFKSEKDQVLKYAGQPSKRTHAVSLNDLTKNMSEDQDHVYAVLSRHGQEEIAVAKVHKVRQLGPKSFELEYDTEFTPNTMMKSVEQDKEYSVRFIHLPKPESDITVVSKNGASIKPLGDKKFQIVLKDFVGAHVLENGEDGFKVKFVSDHGKLKDFFSTISEDYPHLNSDLFVDGNFVSFQIEAFKFDEDKKTLTMEVFPMDNFNSRDFFSHLNRTRELYGKIKIHVDGMRTGF